MPDRYVLGNVPYKGELWSFGWGKELLDNGKPHKQDDWPALTTREFKLASGPMYFASLLALYDNRNSADPGQKGLVEKVKTMFKDDFDPAKTVSEVEKLIAMEVNMISYGEIRPGDDKLSFSSLFKMFINVLNLPERKEDKFTVWINEMKNTPFLGVILTKKEHIWKALKAFLRKDR